MRRTFKTLGVSVVVVAILALAIGSTVGAAGNHRGTGAQTQNQGAEWLCGECHCDSCVCGDCDPINHAYSYNYSYLSPGSHGFANNS